MGKSTTAWLHSHRPSTCSWFVQAGLAYLLCFAVFFCLAMILEPYSRRISWDGWQRINLAIFALAMILFLAGISLLAWFFLDHWLSRWNGRLSGGASGSASVWDPQLDGAEPGTLKRSLTRRPWT
jgi:hypothetical protein